MPIPFAESLHLWQAFFTFAGGASATLVGLLFVALSLGSHLVSQPNQVAFDAFVTPILLHFIAVLALAGLLLAPLHTPFSLAAGLLVFGLAGLGHLLGTIGQILRLPNRRLLLTDHWLTHIALPSMSFLLQTLAAGWLWASGAPEALALPAGGAFTLLICGIWRSWLLVIWIAQQGRPNTPGG